MYRVFANKWERNPSTRTLFFPGKVPFCWIPIFKKLVCEKKVLMKSLIFDKISFEQGKRHFRTPPRPSTRHLEKNPLSTTVFKGLTSCSVSFSFSRLRKNVFQNKLFQVLIWLYKAFIVLMVDTTHTTCCFSRSQTSSYLTFRSFIKMQWRKIEVSENSVTVWRLLETRSRCRKVPSGLALGLWCSEMWLQKFKV